MFCLRAFRIAGDYACMKRILPLLLAVFIAWPAQGADAPRRVVSFNVCADQLVVMLADPEQIAGLSPYAADPFLSVVADKAKEFRRLHWQAEATIAIEPDLVFIGPNDRSVTRRMLAMQGMRVVEAGLVADIDSARNQIREVAGLLGHPDRGERMIAELDAARARLAAMPHSNFTTALVVERGGYLQGPSSLAAALLSEAGLKPPANAPAGYGGFIPLEKLLMLKPDLIFLKDPPSAPTDQGAVYFMHPALQALWPPRQRLSLPTRYAICGGPALIEAFDYLRTALMKLAAR